MNLSDMPIITSPYLTDPEDRVVRRTWRERLFSRPWRPFVTEKTIIVQVPSKRVLVMGGKFVMHPSALQSFRLASPSSPQKEQT